MSLYGMMRTGVSGMNAQANRLSAVSDNIANSSTTGYKAASTEFSSLLLPSSGSTYNSGGVETNTTYGVSEQGSLTYTSSDTDLAINGNGFFIVQDSSGSSFLTRAGSFTPDDNGDLVNSAGYTLMGYAYGDDEEPASVANGYAGLDAINVGSSDLSATASTNAVFSANVDSGAEAVTGTTPGTASAGTESADLDYTSKSSIKAYDSLGNEVIFDVYFTKTDDNTWEAAVYNNADADADTGSFPYANEALASDTFEFDPDTGAIIDGGTTELDITDGSVENMGDFTFDFSGMTQLAYDFSVSDATVDGNGASQVTGVEISSDGTVNAKYDNGDTTALYKIAMANVESPDNMSVLSGNVFSATAASGDVQIGFAGSSGFGDIVSGALEDSTVDLADELTTMIASQRSYTANSKVFQTASDLLDTLVNLAR
jgi:flagellar hook protein FlgE